jgi:putative effector of murein hydrolase LrgA (UPF0299 family)
MTAIRMVLMNKRVSRAIDLLILILGCLLVPYTHGFLQYFGVIVATLMLIAVKYIIFRSRYR